MLMSSNDLYQNRELFLNKIKTSKEEHHSILELILTLTSITSNEQRKASFCDLCDRLGADMFIYFI